MERSEIQTFGSDHPGFRYAPSRLRQLKIPAALNPSHGADQQIDFLMRIVKRQ